LADREDKVKPSTLKGYRVVVKCITEPLLVGTRQERVEYSLSAAKPAGAKIIPTLGDIKITDLSTAMIREWHRCIVDNVGNYTARRACSHLKMILALAEEDFGVRASTMPMNLSRRKTKTKKTILQPDQVGVPLEAAKADREHGIYYAFPFLAGTRPSEQLGLLWEDVDLENNVIHIRRMQERDGTLTDTTKTDAGTREIPIAPILREMLLEWRVRCPRRQSQHHRVFPGPGRLQPWPLPRTGGGGPLLYQNWLRRYWKPAFAKLDLPYVEPHSARHCFISTLQAQGVEVGLVAKLAGHANPAVTLSHYTQAVRGGEQAIAALEDAYAGAM
jgi:integrase